MSRANNNKPGKENNMPKLRAHDPKEAKVSKPKILIFGRPGVGKTWGSLDFPSVYYIDTEGGANLDHYTDKLKKAGGVYLGPDDGSNDFNVVTEEIIALATTKHDYRTLIIDSYSKIFNTQVSADHERMDKNGRDMEKTFGAEKKPAINWTRKWLRWFDKLDMNVILICHERDVYKDGKMTGTNFDGWDKLEYELHLALRIVKQGNSRIANVTKTRLEKFEDGATFPWSYAEFAKRYGQDVIESAATPIVPATAEQIGRLNQLIDLLKVPADLTDKWMEKAGVDEWREMDTDTIQKCLDYLTVKLPKVA
jgi:hypothetical protein